MHIVQEAQLSHRDCATLYASNFMLFQEIFRLERFQTTKVIFNSFKNIRTGAIR